MVFLELVKVETRKTIINFNYIAVLSNKVGHFKPTTKQSTGHEDYTAYHN